jgi:single-strand DNA-binding protein
MADNTVTLVGTLGTDPEVRRTAQGKDVANFNLVTNERIRNADDSWSDGAASWFRITAWNALGRNAAMSFRKGQRVIVRGVLKVEQWKAKDGSTAKTVVLTASSLGHDLQFGTTTFARAASTSSAPPAREPVREQEAQQDGWGAADEPEADGPERRELQPAWSAPMADDEVPF